LIVSIGLILLVGIASWAVYSIRFQRQKALDSVASGVERLGNTIKLGTHYAMMLNSRDDITEITKQIGEQKGIENIRIYNKRGQIKFSNIAGEIERTTNVRNEACLVCHKQEPALEQVALSERTRIFDPGEGYRHLGVITPIYNEPFCAGEACHTHPEKTRVLGLLDVVVSLKDTDQDIQAYQRRIIALAASLFLGTSLVVAIFLMRSLNRPIRKLIAETRHIGNGEYDNVIDLTQKDEIGQMARAIQKMREDIHSKQNELKQNWYEYQNLFEESPCYITVQDRSLKILRYNREFQRRFSPDPGDYCYWAYKGRSTKCDVCPVMKTFEDGEPHSSEEAAIDKDGTETYWMVRTSPIKNAQGEVIAAMEMSLDLTHVKFLEREARKSEEKYRVIFDTIPNPVFVLDAETLKILDCNDSVAAVYGFSKKEMLRKTFLDLFDPSEREEIAPMIKASNVIERTRQVRKDGDIIYVTVRVSSSEEYAVHPVLLVTTSDITMRLVAEQQLIQSSKMATLGEMATGVAHELNQPLSVIKTASSFIKRKVTRGEPIPEESLKAMAEEMDSHVDRAEKIIQHMREFGRKADVAKAKVQVNEVLKRALDLFKQQLKLRGIEVSMELCEDLPLILAEENRLEQVFINLLINARDAVEKKWEAGRPEGERKKITLATLLEPQGVTVKIGDNGTGIPKAILDKIFEPFFTTKKVGKGTGLGLSISYGIVRDYDGTIEVVTKEGEGSTFLVRFPLPEEA